MRKSTPGPTGVRRRFESSHDSVTKVKMSLGFVAILAVVVLIGNPLRLFKGEKPRNCGSDIRPRNVVAVSQWQPKAGQERSYVRITGNIGPTTFDEPRAGTSPAKFAAQACPGETVLIVVAALSGPLTSITCGITTGGFSITGDAILRTNVAGHRARCEATIT